MFMKSNINNLNINKMKTLNLFKKSTLIIAMAVIGIFGLNKSYANGDIAAAPKMNIVETAISNNNFSILVEAVVKAELADALSAVGPYTVFAPTNEAFEDLFKELGVSGIDELTKEQLTPILLNHVVSGKVMASDVKTSELPTLNKESDLDIKVSKKGVKINGNTMVVATDIEATNGVIHVVDAVILPQSKTQASNSSSSCN